MSVLVILTLHYHKCPKCNSPWSHDDENCTMFIPSSTNLPYRRSGMVCEKCKEDSPIGLPRNKD